MKATKEIIQWMIFRPERAALLSPSRRRKCNDHVRQKLGVSERRACRTLGQHRSTQRKVPRGRADEDRLTDDIIELAAKYGRYGYRMVAGLLNNAGWQAICTANLPRGDRRVERLWRREGLKVPQKKKKGRLWLNPLGTLLRNALPGSGRILRTAPARTP